MFCFEEVNKLLVRLLPKDGEVDHVTPRVDEVQLGQFLSTRGRDVSEPRHTVLTQPFLAGRRT